jgi:hypothetical protein
MEDQKILDVKKKASEIQEMYKTDVHQGKSSILLCGESGSGKTKMVCNTAIKPVHIDSFDSGGTKLPSIRKQIEKGEVIADTRWEGDDPYNPDRFINWVTEMQHRMKIGYFDYLGTYFLDSCTVWSDTIMNQILKKAGIPAEPPRFTKDYNPQKVQILNWIKFMKKMPCNFITTMHLEAHKDEVTGAISYRIMTTGKAVALIPLEFDEIYVASPKETSKGNEYRIITQNTGPYLASTRIGEGVFDTYEKPDIKYLLGKAGLPTEDKPLLT